MLSLQISMLLAVYTKTFVQLISARGKSSYSFYDRRCYSRKPAKCARLGRPADDIRLEAFNDAVQNFEEHDYDQVTIADISSKMVELLEGTNLEPYGNKYLKQVLTQHYGDRVIISSDRSGAKSVIIFRQTAEVSPTDCRSYSA